MNPLIAIIVLVIVAALTSLVLWLSHLKRTSGARKEKKELEEKAVAEKTRLEKAQAAALKLTELRAVALREGVNLIELAHSVDPDLLNHLSLEDVMRFYHSSPASIQKKIMVTSHACSTFEGFWSLATNGYPLSTGAVEKMLRFLDFWSLVECPRRWQLAKEHYRFPFWDTYNRVYWGKFCDWLEHVQSCAEITRLPSWRLDSDHWTSTEWHPAGMKFVQLCRKEMSGCNDLPTLWRLRSYAWRCKQSYDVYKIREEIFLKILSLTHDLGELKRLANPKTYEDRVETDEDAAKEHYLKTVQGILLKCRSVEELRTFLASHEIPEEAGPLSLRLMAQLPEMAAVA